MPHLSHFRRQMAPLGGRQSTSHLSQTLTGLSWNWHLDIEQLRHRPIGCRGFLGPVPSTTLNETVLSTDQDTMITCLVCVNSFCKQSWLFRQSKAEFDYPLNYERLPDQNPSCWQLSRSLVVKGLPHCTKFT